MSSLIFSNFIFIFLTSFFYLAKSSDVILFHMNYYYKTEDSLSSYLYTKIKIGEPDSIIYAYISSKISLFSMIEVTQKLDQKELSTYYNMTLSQSFKNISSLGMKYVTSNKDIHAQEKFMFNLYNNRTKQNREVALNNLDFVLGVKLIKLNENIYFMNIGFPIIRSGSLRDKFYFISQLKEKDIIDTYDWFIYFENDIELNKDEVFNVKDLPNINLQLIIGGPTHYYKNDLFYKSQLIFAYTEAYAWTIKFKDIYIYLNEKTIGETKKISLQDNTIEIYLNDLKIYAPPYYTNLIKREFFNKYSSCHEIKEIEKIYYCDKSDNFTLNDLKTFPTLYLEHFEYNYIFELTFQDLFVENEGKYIFLVTENKDENWLIGFSFLKKYQFVFNEDSKTIGFYNPNLPKEKEIDEDEDEGGDEDKPDTDTDNDTKSDDNINSDDNENKEDIQNKTSDRIDNKPDNENMNSTIIILIVVICVIIFVVFGLILIKLLLKNNSKKRRANELDDNYDYSSYENPNEGNIN